MINVSADYDKTSIFIIHCVYLNFLVPRAYHGTATIDRLIYVIGGFDGMDYFNSCRVFNTETFQWNEIAPMNVRR